MSIKILKIRMVDAGTVELRKMVFPKLLIFCV